MRWDAEIRYEEINWYFESISNLNMDEREFMFCKNIDEKARVVGWYHYSVEESEMHDGGRRCN